VVAIIGILAAIAIPNFMRFQLKAKASEGKTNLAAIRTAEESYMAEFGTYVGTNVGGEPVAVPGTMKSLWPGADPGFLQLGWAPEGSVYYQYEVSIPANGVDFWAVANADIDGNGIPNQWAYVKPVPGNALTAGAPAISAVCVGTGVYDPATTNQDLLNTVGPCDNLSGASEF
jgi:type IV pilus assembly protein PilA